MSLSADAPIVSRPASSLAAGAMALGVHALFLMLLVFGVSWQTQHPEPVMVDLWDALPAATLPAVVKPTIPQPEPVPELPEPVKAPEPIKDEPLPKPQSVVKEVPQPKAPDIALEKKKAEAERLKKLEALQAAEDKALEEATRAEAATMKKAREKQLADQKKRELLRQMEEEEALMQRMADEEAASAARVAASRRQAETARMVGVHRDKISAKVRGNTRLPDGLNGNPEVRCLVRLLPTGEVVSVRVTHSSGNAAYDDAVVRAIEKSSPLPLPDDRDARAEFVPELSFIHRPKA
ncbi:MAG: cell envelope integrity protein TolA [Thiobacillus sp.]